MYLLTEADMFISSRVMRCGCL